MPFLVCAGVPGYLRDRRTNLWVNQTGVAKVPPVPAQLSIQSAHDPERVSRQNIQHKNGLVYHLSEANLQLEKHDNALPRRARPVEGG